MYGVLRENVILPQQGGWIVKVHDGSGTYNGMKDRLEVGLEVDVDVDGESGGEEKKRLREK